MSDEPTPSELAKARAKAEQFRALLLRVASRFIEHGVDCALKTKDEGGCDCGAFKLEADIKEALFAEFFCTHCDFTGPSHEAVIAHLETCPSKPRPK